MNPLLMLVQNWHLLALAAAGGAFTGALGAARADYQAYISWDRWQDFQSYDWRLASFRWVHGAIVGAVGGVGLVAAQAGVSALFG